MVRSFRFMMLSTVMLAVVIVLSNVVFPGQAMGQRAFHRDDKVNKSIQDVIDGKANKQDIETLEQAVKADPNNADLQGVLAGAYGLVAEATADTALGDKAEQAAAKAHQLNPNSVSAQIAQAGVDVQSKDKGKREKAIALLAQHEAAAPHVTKYLRGKGLILDGKDAEGEKLLNEAAIDAAQRVKKDKQQIKEKHAK